MIEPKLTLTQLATLLSRSADAAGAAADTEPDLLHSGWYTTEEVADLIGVDPSTLRRWRTSVPLQGPPFVQMTSRVTMYSIPDVQAWLHSRRVEPSRAA